MLDAMNNNLKYSIRFILGLIGTYSFVKGCITLLTQSLTFHQHICQVFSVRSNSQIYVDQCRFVQPEGTRVYIVRTGDFTNHHESQEVSLLSIAVCDESGIHTNTIELSKAMLLSKTQMLSIATLLHLSDTTSDESWFFIPGENLASIWDSPVVYWSCKMQKPPCRNIDVYCYYLRKYPANPPAASLAWLLSWDMRNVVTK